MRSWIGALAALAASGIQAPGEVPLLLAEPEALANSLVGTEVGGAVLEGEGRTEGP